MGSSRRLVTRPCRAQDFDLPPGPPCSLECACWAGSRCRIQEPSLLSLEGSTHMTSCYPHDIYPHDIMLAWGSSLHSLGLSLPPPSLLLPPPLTPTPIMHSTVKGWRAGKGKGKGERATSKDSTHPNMLPILQFLAPDYSGQKPAGCDPSHLYTHNHLLLTGLLYFLHGLFSCWKHLS